MSENTVNNAQWQMGCDARTEITGNGFRAMARAILHESLRVDPAVIEHPLAYKGHDAKAVSADCCMGRI